MKLKSREFLFGAIILFTFLIVSVVFYTYQIFYTPNLQVAKKNDAYLYIPEKANFQTVIDSLKENKMIEDIISFAFIAKILKYQTNVKPGRYLIKKNMTNLEAIRELRRGVQSPVKYTFNNIRLKKDFCIKTASYFNFEADELYKMLNDSVRTQKYGFDTTNIISMFIPDTYQLYWNTRPEKLLERMHKEYLRFWNKERQQKAQTLGLTPQQVAVLASIIQAETQKNDEKPRIAGVYINRLQKNMPLDADPTLVYALQDFTIKRVLDKHKRIDSPYNTYRNKGLPPGPINMPSPKSIDAVLDYEQHKYIFFCAKEDFSGYHNFAENYTDHMKNARLYQAALDMKGIR